VAYGPGQAYPPQPGVPAGGAGAGVPWMNPGWLAASADRERAVGVLRAGFAEGRLSQDELDDRVAQAYGARTYGELWTLTADLPAGPLVPSYGPVAVPANHAPQAGSWRPAAALIITALIIFTLAALITAIITAHTGQPVPFRQVNVQLVPDQQDIAPPGVTQQGAVLTPYVRPAPGYFPGRSAFGGPADRP
jgi:hypothetical protein